MNSEALLKEIDAGRELHIRLLQRFTRAPSPNPPGDTRRAATALIGHLNGREYVPFEPFLTQPTMATFVCDMVCGDSAGPRLIMNGHLDVFPVGDGEEWSRNPWSGDVEGGRLYGKGTVDMKAGTAASIIAYSYIYKYREHLKGSACLCVVPDAKTGGKWGTQFLLDDTRYRGDCMINAGPGGVNTIRFGEKGNLRLTFEIKTEGAHGAYLHRSIGANRLAAKLINDLLAVEKIVPKLPPGLEEYMTRPEVRETVDEAMGVGAADIVLKPTLNIGTIHGGLKVNMIPDSCIFEADIRLPIGLKASEVLEVIRGILEAYPEATLTVQEAASNPSSSYSHEHPMVDILARNAGSILGKKPVAIPSLGATDCKFYRYQDIPAYVFGVSPKSMGTKDESVSVDEFIAVLKIHALAAWEYLGGEM
ncbi:Succinyl-diaminopimelate desuccinylase [Lachnellula suecica]|uniref:Succinyl-diaminopimelate desuccinylase n=1 Tax=Lachnellula suecica TaxID=602035 RepID=A0A8T9C3S6_9HELO|nr:Succinyl-diaminopimelate desuccinylase [Lachnellula suecica]